MGITCAHYGITIVAQYLTLNLFPNSSFNFVCPSCLTCGCNLPFLITQQAAATVASMVPRPPPALKKVALMLVGGRRRYGRRSNSGGGGSSFGGSTFGGTTIGSKKSKGKKGQPGDPPLDPTAVLDKSGSAANRMFSDRVVQYLAESYVCSNPKVVLDDAELSYNGRVGWRAIARALRKRYCSFVLPGLFVPPKAINIVHLVLTRNELDCGDAVLIADVLLYQRALRLVDLSFNRIGARGMCRMAKTVRDHPQISYFAINHNIIGTISCASFVCYYGLKLID